MQKIKKAVIPAAGSGNPVFTGNKINAQGNAANYR